MARKTETMPSNKAELSALVAQMTGEFIAKGGSIQKIRSGRRALESAIDFTSNEIVKGKE